MKYMRALTGVGLTLLLVAPLAAAGDGIEFFEKQIRPVLAARCYACHSARSKPVQGGLYLDSKEGMLRGGKSGAPAVVPGKPEESLIVQAMQKIRICS